MIVDFDRPCSVFFNFLHAVTENGKLNVVNTGEKAASHVNLGKHFIQFKEHTMRRCWIVTGHTHAEKLLTLKPHATGQLNT